MRKLFGGKKEEKKVEPKQKSLSEMSPEEMK